MERFSLQFRERPVQSILQIGQSKFVQLSFEPGQGLSKHRAPLALTVVVLTGQIQFTVGDRTEIMNASDMLTLNPDIEHEVAAIVRSTVLLVLTPDGTSSAKPAPVAKQPLEHENAFEHPELLDQIAEEIRPLVEDHIQLCQVLQSVEQTPDIETMRIALHTISQELNSHFPLEEQFLFPRMASHVGGMDVGPVARLLEEHQHIRQLHAEADELMSACERLGDEHTRMLLTRQMSELSRVLLNHLGKEDSHLFPMASRLLTTEEKVAVAKAIQAHLTSSN